MQPQIRAAAASRSAGRRRGRPRASTTPIRIPRARPYVDRAPAAQRDRRAAPRACAAARRSRDTIIRMKRMQGFNVLFQPATTTPASRPRTSSRSALAPGRNDAPRARSRGVRGARLGVAARVRRQDHDAVPPHRRLARLPPHALHDGRRVRPRGDAVLRAPLGQGLDLPREPDHQLVPVPPDLALRSRARARGRRRHAHDDPLPASPTATATSRSPPCGPRRSSATSPSPCIPTTSATSTRSAAR